MKNVYLTDDKNNIVYPITTSSNVLTKDGYRIEDKLSQYEADLKGTTMIFNNVVVPFSDFIEDTTYEGYPYKVDISLEGITENHYVNMISLEKNNNFTNFCDTFNGYISIYAKQIPTEDLIIDTIFCTKEVEVSSEITEIAKNNKGVFIAEYNTTTFAEIKEAVEAGKACFCKVNSVDIDDSPEDEDITVTGISIILLPMTGFCDSTVTAPGYEGSMQYVQFSHTESGNTLSVELNIEGGVETWSLTEKTLPLDSYIKKTDKPIVIYTNIEVLTSSFVEDTTYTDYPFKADIVCENITENHFVKVQFSSEQITSKNYSGNCNSSSGIVTIYAKEVPAENIVIHSIIGFKEV